MRFLNRIIFINSASIKYAEIGLDGNVHLIGTQGVGKSTLLRAILFFYNANKSKLGIPIQKRRFDDYYFEYQNSYIIYEIVKDNTPFCVLAYKVNGKVAFRFFNSAYKRELFIDPNGKAQSWEDIRQAFGKTIYYTKIVSSYDEYRKILYGDNKGLKSEYRKYALIESKQYQNIPRTIQNVLLNSNLEAKFIKDTIINSISEDEFKIDLSNYSKNHLRDFETQINDIRIWFKKNKRGQIVVRNQADTIIENYRILNFLKREKRELAIDLFSRIDYIERERSELLTTFASETETLEKLDKKRETLKDRHKRDEQNIISEIKQISTKLIESKQKLAEYNNKNIKTIIEKVDQKDALINEKESKIAERQLLTSTFTEISQKYDALIVQIQNQQKEFENERNAEINQAESEFGDRRLALQESYNELIEKIRAAHKDEEERNENELESLTNSENSIKRKRAELRHKTFFNKEIEICKKSKQRLLDNISKAKALINNANNETITVRKEWELEQKEIERTAENSIEKEQTKLQAYSNEIAVIQNNLEQSKSSLYGWLNETIPNWEDTIGKVIDEKDILFRTHLNPKQVTKNSNTFFGIELDLSLIDKRVKTVDEFNQEIVKLTTKSAEIRSLISSITKRKDNSSNNLKIKFKKRLSTLKGVLSENEYTLSQSNEKLKTNKIALEEWEAKASSEKLTVLQKLEENLESLSIEKERANNNLKRIERAINRETSKKRRERGVEIGAIEELKDETIKEIKVAISKRSSDSEERILELKRQQNSELGNRGADTKRLTIIDHRLSEIDRALNFIKDNEVLVIEYRKDKRELFDRVPQFKVDKSSSEKRQASMIKDQKIEKERSDAKFNQQNEKVQIIKTQIDEFDNDVKKFNQFKITDTFLSIQDYVADEIDTKRYSKTAILIIEELNDKHYKSISKFKDLQQSTNSFVGNFNEHNIFKFRVKLNDDADFMTFATELKEFIDEDKIDEFETRVNRRFAHIIQLIGNETTELQSKESEIEKIIRKINNDFTSKNFVDAIKRMELRTEKSSNPVVKLLIKIREFNDENSLSLGEDNLFTSSDTTHKNSKAVELLKQLIKELERYKNSYLTLSESFDLQFRIVENDNDSGWVERLSNVGSEGTDVLVKAMINILLLNVFKNSASKKFQDFKLHCMMDEIGRLHPNNVKGILRFANERNILLINGSPTSQNAIDYKYTYKLSKEQSKMDNKKYITKITQLVKVRD